MQIRKRAKSISFGKTNKEKGEDKKVEEKIVHKVAVEKNESTHVQRSDTQELSHAAKKVQDYELTPVQTSMTTEKKQLEKEESSELSSELASITPEEQVVTSEPSAKTEVSKPSEVVSEGEFLSDTSVNDVEKAPQEKQTETLSDNPIILSAPSESIVTPVSDTDSSVAIEPVVPAEGAPVSQELSPTPPSSAFTLQGNTNDAMNGGTRKNVILYFLLVAFISFALGLGVMAGVSYFGLLPNKLPVVSFDPNMVNNLNPMKPSPTVVPTKAPTPTPTDKPVDLKAYKISVLNGSGIRGKAAELQTTLTTSGFTVITAGNADRSDYLTTQVVAKKTVPQEYLDKLEAELEKSFTVDTLSTMPSEANQTADVIITIGKKTAE